MKKHHPSTRGSGTLKGSTPKPKLLLEGERSIEDVLNLIRFLSTEPAKWTPTLAIATIDAVRTKVSRPFAIPSTEWATTFLTLGKFAKQQLGRRFNKQVFIKLLLQKHEMYGAEPLLRWGLFGILMRIDSKLFRYVNIMSHDDAKKLDETTTDTLTDILGYCVLGYRLCCFYFYSGEKAK